MIMDLDEMEIIWNLEARFVVTRCILPGSGQCYINTELIFGIGANRVSVCEPTHIDTVRTSIGTETGIANLAWKGLSWKN